MNNKRMDVALRDYIAFHAVVMAVRGVSLEETEESLIEVFLQTVVREYSLCMAWYGRYADNEIRPIKSAGRVDKYLDNLVLNIERSQSPDVQCAMSRAILDDCCFGYSDLENDEGFRPWRDYAMELGYRSNLALPLKVGGEIEGGIMIYADTRKAFPDKRAQRLKMLSTELSTIIQQRRKHQTLIADRRRRERTIAALLNATTELAMLCDTDGNIVALNQAAATRFGLSITEATGKYVYDFLEPEVARRRKAVARKIIESKKGLRVTDESRGRVFDNSVYPVFDNNGNVKQFAVFAKDVTEKKLAEQKLDLYKDRLRAMASQLSLAEEKERRRIASKVHDDLGQNLAFVKMKLIQFLNTDISPNGSEVIGDVLTLLNSIIESTRSLVSEIGNPVLYELGLEQAIEQLVKQTEQGNGVDISFNNDSYSKPLREDIKVILFQAVRELLTNVIKHSKASVCTVSLKTEGDRIRVNVEDDGVGFDFDEIYSHMDQKDGFGLFNIRERLEPLGGSIEVYSKPKEKTVVTIFAPLGE